MKGGIGSRIGILLHPFLIRYRGSSPNRFGRGDDLRTRIFRGQIQKAYNSIVNNLWRIMSTEDVLGEMAGFFKALGDPNRLKIIYFLATDPSGTLGVGDLARLLGISQPAVTQHLKILKGVQIVEARKEGYRMYFSFNRERLLHYQGQSEFLNDCIMGKCDQDEGYAGQEGGPDPGTAPKIFPKTGVRMP